MKKIFATLIIAVFSVTVFPANSVFANGVDGSPPSLPSDTAISIGDTLNEEFFTSDKEALNFMDDCRAMGFTNCEERYEAYDAAHLQYEIYMAAVALGENVAFVPKPARSTYLQPYSTSSVTEGCL